PDFWRVHVHLDHASEAIDAGSRAGRVEQVSITAMNRSIGVPAGSASDAPGVALLCCAPGEGLAQVFAEAGASVVHSSAGNRASTGQLLSAAQETSARAVILLPNDPDTVLAAEAAARAAAEDGRTIRVVPTLAAVQGLAAVSVWDPDTEDLDASLAAMVEAARDVRYGALTRAASEAVTPVGRCYPGQWLGFVSNEIVAVEDDLAPAARRVLVEMASGLAQDAEVVTVVEGARSGGDGQEGGDIDELLRRGPFGSGEGDQPEVRRITGGQRTYRWLLGME
ncbi:MAG: dihydroxyacetone kinase, partial [Ornithinimicrobium sp.]